MADGDVVWLDTSILQPHCWDHPPDEQELAQDTLEGLRGNIDRHGTQVRISFLAIGELVNNYVRAADGGRTEVGIDEMIRQFGRLCEQLDAEFRPPTEGLFELGQEVYTKHTHDGVNDAIIAAQALADPRATHLITMDDSYIRSAFMSKKARELQEDGERWVPFNIKESY